MAEKQNINQNIDHSKEAFYANGFAIFCGGEITIDFRQTLARDDETTNGSMRSLSAKHQPIVITPQTAKMLFTILKEQVDAIEKNIGKEIELPKEWRTKPQKSEENGVSSSSSIR